MGQTIFDAGKFEGFLTWDSASAFLRSSQHFQLLTYDSRTLTIYGGKFLTSRGVLFNYVRQMQAQKLGAENLNGLIIHEYDLKND